MMTSQGLTCRDYESGVLSQCRLLVKHNPLTCTVFLVQNEREPLAHLGVDGQSMVLVLHVYAPSTLLDKHSILDKAITVS